MQRTAVQCAGAAAAVAARTPASVLPMPPATLASARAGPSSSRTDSPRPLSTSVTDPPLDPPRLRSHYDEPVYLQRYRGQRRLRPIVQSEAKLATGVDREPTPDRAAKRSRRELESAWEAGQEPVVYRKSEVRLCSRRFRFLVASPT